ncbi:MAG: hypothetical protein ACIPMY_05250 [Rickettsia endosymbiont of Pentastiridius leporinus]
MKKNVFQESIENYSINLLWINDKKNINQQYIHPAKSEEELITKFLTPAIKWSKANPLDVGADINIWYNSEVYEKQAVFNTQKILDELAKENECSNIKLRDVKDINVVQQNSFLFDEKVPLYFRIDFLKMIICLHALKNEEKDAAIFSDLEVGDLRIDKGRMSKAELFDKKSMEKLEEHGILMNAGPLGYIENQFIQIVNKETIVSALWHVINACLMRGTDTLNMPTELQKHIMPKMHEMPYYSITNEVFHYYMGIKYNAIAVREDFIKEGGKSNNWIEYNPKIHGYKALGNHKLDNHRYINLDFSQNPPKSSGKILKFDHNMSDEVYEKVINNYDRTRKIDTRDGNKHEDKIILPEAGHPPFICKFWEVDTTPTQTLIIEELGILGGSTSY